MVKIINPIRCIETSKAVTGQKREGFCTGADNPGMITSHKALETEAERTFRWYVSYRWKHSHGLMSGWFLLSPDVADVSIMVVQRLELCHFFY